jgi:hypothetical protein
MAEILASRLNALINEVVSLWKERNDFIRRALIMAT